MKARGADEPVGQVQRDDRTNLGKAPPGMPILMSLAPLREEGRDAIETANIPGLSRVVLREVQVTWDDLNCQTTTLTGADIFDCRPETGAPEAIPLTGAISQAAFDFYFSDSPKPRQVKMKVPCHVEVAQESDTEIVHRWATVRHFKLDVQPPEVPR
jgi:hypothetical protein